MQTPSSLGELEGKESEQELGPSPMPLVVVSLPDGSGTAAAMALINAGYYVEQLDDPLDASVARAIGAVKDESSQIVREGVVNHVRGSLKGKGKLALLATSSDPQLEVISEVLPDATYVVAFRHPSESASHGIVAESWEKYYRDLLAALPGDRTKVIDRLSLHFDVRHALATLGIETSILQKRVSDTQEFILPPGFGFDQSQELGAVDLYKSMVASNSAVYDLATKDDKYIQCRRAESAEWISTRLSGLLEASALVPSQKELLAKQADRAVELNALATKNLESYQRLNDEFQRYMVLLKEHIRTHISELEEASAQRIGELIGWVQDLDTRCKHPWLNYLKPERRQPAREVREMLRARRPLATVRAILRFLRPAPASEAPALGTSLAPLPTDEALKRCVGQSRFIPLKIAPLKLNIVDPGLPRVNIVLSQVEPKYFFGGYQAVFHLAKALKSMGYHVRLISTDPVTYDPVAWKTELARYGNVESILSECEFFFGYDRNQPLTVAKNERFLATSWWTAHVAHAATQELGQKRFIYLTQDYEPVFYPRDSFYALAEESLTFPQYTLYSTELLRDYSRRHGIGVFAEGEEEGNRRSASFQNVISASAPTIEKMQSRAKKRFLFYARPEDHASRNCFPLGLVAINEAVTSGILSPDSWELYGIGTVAQGSTMQLDCGVPMHMLKKMSLDEYYRHLHEYDLGLSMMLSPHPSLVPLDMAASGVVAITNTYENKKASDLIAISENLIPVPTTLTGLADGIRRGAIRVPMYGDRLKASEIKWARSWGEAFDEPLLNRIAGWLEGG